jgi:hypothetical protein
MVTMAMVIVMDTSIIMVMAAMAIMVFMEIEQGRILISPLNQVIPILIKKRKVSGINYGRDSF